MAISTALITGRITRPGTDIGIRARVTATPQTTAAALKFSTEDVITWGPVVVETDDDGNLPDFRIPLGSDSGDSVLWRFTAESLDRLPGVPKTWGITTAFVTTSTPLTDLANVELTVTTPDLVEDVGALVVQAEAAAAAAEAVGTLADTQIAGRIEDPASETAQALSASTDLRVKTGRRATAGLLDRLIARLSPPVRPAALATVRGVGGANPITGGVTYPYNTENIRKIGCIPVAASQFGQTYIQNYGVGLGGSGATPWALEFIPSPGGILEFVMGFRAATDWTGIRFEVTCNGQPTTLGPIVPAPASVGGGSLSWLHQKFDQPVTGRVRVRFSGADFHSITVPAGCTISAPATIAETIRCANVSDSWWASGVNTDGGWPNGPGEQICAMLGWEPLHASQGGFGYLKGARPFGFQARKDAVIQFAPHFILIAGSQNDDDYTPAAIQAAAAQLYADYATALPNTKIIVIGRQPTPSNDYLTAANIARRDAVKAAAAAAPNVLGFIDPMEERWLDGSGSVTDPKGDGVADYYVAPDRLHISQMGAAYYAQRAVEGILRVLAKAGLPYDRWTGPTISQPLAPLSDLLTDGMLADINVESLAGTADGAAVASLTPTRGSKLDPLTQTTAANQPIYVASDANGKPALKFTGAQKMGAPTWSAPLPLASSLTLFLVHRIAVLGTAGAAYPIDGPTSTSRVRVGIVASTSLYESSATGGSVWPNQPALDTAFKVQAIVMEGGSQKVWQNRLTYETTAVNLTNTALAGVGIGGVGGGSAGWDTRVAHAVAYQGVMSDENVARTIKYLAAKWAVTLT